MTSRTRAYIMYIIMISWFAFARSRSLATYQCRAKENGKKEKEKNFFFFKLSRPRSWGGKIITIRNYKTVYARTHSDFF